MTYRVRNLVIAVGLALVAMMLTFFYVTNYKRSVQRGESNIHVWVAARDVKTGVAGEALVKNHAFKTIEVPKRNVVPGAISDPDQVAKLVLSEPLYVGDQITLRRFTDAKAQGIIGQLKGPLRAVQIPGDPNQLLVGTLKTGDHVDLVASIGVGEQKPHVSRIVLRDIAVLQAPDAAPADKVDANASFSAILAVRDTEVQRLFYVTKNADWTLQLRPVVDAADSSERAENNSTAIVDGLSTAERNRLEKGAH
jgi:Flp pilus assembly protein CpaB